MAECMSGQNPEEEGCGRRVLRYSLGKLLLMCVAGWVLGILVFTWPADARDVRLGLYDNSPKVFVDDSGQPQGIFVDIIEYIAEQEDWDLEYVPGTWEEGLFRLQKGTIDLMPDVAYSSRRAMIYSYHSVPVLSDWFQVYAAKDEQIQSIVDLEGKSITILNNSVQEETFEHMVHSFGLNARLIPLPDYTQAFAMVARGEADAAITNRFYGIKHAKAYGLEDTSVIFHPTKLYFAAAPGAPQGLLAAIDHNLHHLKQDPDSVYYVSLKKWTQEEISFSMPDWIYPLGMIVGVALGASLLFSIVLKQRVNQRTKELESINQEMEQRIEQRTEELAKALEQAREADRIKSAFLATMSHELRTPLNSIIGFTGILLQDLAGPLNQEQRKQMSMVQHSARHLLSLINDVLDIAKIESGQLELSMSDFSVQPSIHKVVELIAPQAEKKGLQVQVEMDSALGRVYTDQRRLEQVVLNLVNNAVKFTDQGLIRIACRFMNGYLHIAVADTGPGIPKEEANKLFEPFQQGEQGTDRIHEGTGLGLSICKKLVDLMGGNIYLDSELGKGSTFTVQIPVQEQDTGRTSAKG